jgi:FtsP/CotA-like multicopper oxidase with cupredoxin domain
MKFSRRSLIKTATFGAFSLGLFKSALSKEAVTKLSLAAKRESLNWFENEPSVKVWGYDQSVLSLRQFEPTVIRFTNQLDEPTSVHWHGMAVENSMDGVSGLTQDPVEPGEKFDYELTPKDAGTFWAHAHHETYRQLALGLYAPVIVKEREHYPVDEDLLFVADDWLIDEMGQVDQASLENRHAWSHGGRMGNFLTINRERTPEYVVTAGSRVRLRVINVANSRVMQFSFPGVVASIIAKDGQPLAEPQKLPKKLIVAPAERFDLVIDIPADWKGEYPIYESTGQSNYLAANWIAKEQSALSQDHGKVLALPPNPLPKLNSKNNHAITLDMKGGAMGNLRAAYYQGKKMSVNELVSQGQFWTFNGVANMPKEPLLTVRVGESIEVTLKNTTQWPHAMHLHGHHFLADHDILGRNIWQDTLLVKARKSETIRFAASTPGKWLLHCHMIEHQVSGMVTYIEVTE